MKRGLIFWDRTAWPEEEFCSRIERVKAAMRHEGLDVLLIYGDACQSGDLSYLTHFIPYADTGLFAMPLHGPPRLFTTHALRNMAWFRTITWVEDIICTNSLGRECAEYLSNMGISCRKIGTLPARTFPQAVASAVLEQPNADLTDFTEIYEKIRAVKSDREMAYVRKAADIASAVFEVVAARWQPGISGFEAAAEMEREARSRGAEDLFCFFQTDDSAELTLPNASRILRQVSIEIAVEYNGYWAKLGRTTILNGGSDRVRSAVGRFEDAYRMALDAWIASCSLTSFFETLRAHWKAPVAFQIDCALEPYWGMSFFQSNGAHGILEDQGALYLQTSAFATGLGRFLRTDTFAFKSGRPELISASHYREGSSR